MEKIKVALFCGGRGSSALIRNFRKRNDIDLTLLVNAYDDGLSTGALRRFIPGMLGPSDFRKNISTLLALHSPEQYGLRAIIEYRLPDPVTEKDVGVLENFASTASVDGLNGELKTILGNLKPELVQKIAQLLATFFQYYKAANGQNAFSLADCSVGNLLFASLYLRNDRDFNRTIRAMAENFGVWGNIVNVSKGECRTLAALKKDGQILVDECSIVSPQSSSPIHDLYFISTPPPPRQFSLLKMNLEII